MTRKTFYTVTSDGYVPQLSWLYSKLDRNDILRIAVSLGDNTRAIEGVIAEDGSITVPVPIRVYGGSVGTLNPDGTRTIMHKHTILPA